MTSLQSVAFLHITLVTIGVIVFGALFQNKCAYILELTEQRYNDTLEEVHRQNTAATEDHRTCMENNGRGIVEIGDLQGRLDGQTTLSRKYQHLLQEHEPVKEKVGELLTELKRKEQELNQQFQLHSDQRNDLIGQLDSQRQELDEALKINQKLVEEMIAETRNEREEHETTQRRVQQRHNSLCKQRFRGGPYYVQFTISIEGHYDKSTFVVEVPSRSQLPHSVFTFLSLIDEKLYDGFAVSFQSNHLSFELGIQSEFGSILSNKYKALGFHESALSFMETSSMFRCVKNSMGFAEFGPTLKVTTASNNKVDSIDDSVCFGRVVRGIKTLALMQLELERGSSVHVVEAKYLELK